MNFYEECDFERTVWTVGEAGPVPWRLGTLCLDHAEETTAPDGVGPVYHLRGTALMAWNRDGSKRFVHRFETHAEAEHALLLTFKFDLDSHGPDYFESEAEAQEQWEELE